MKFSPSAAAAVVSLATAVSAKSSCKPKIDSELIQADIKTERYVYPGVQFQVGRAGAD